MTFEEKSGQYSLFECLVLTEKKYQKMRPHFAFAENLAFAELLAQVKAGQTDRQRGRIVMDITIFLRSRTVTGVERVAIEYIRVFLAMAQQEGFELAFIGLQGNAFELYEIENPETMGNRPRFKPAGRPFQFRIGDQVLFVEVGFGKLDEFFTAAYRARNVGAVINLIIHDLIPFVNIGWSDEEFAVHNFVKWSQSLRFADRLIAVSRKVARDMVCYVAATSMVGLTPTRKLPIAWCTLGCDPLHFEDGKTAPLNFPVDQNTLIAVGTLTTRKCPVQLVKAMQILWAEDSEAKLVLIGQDLGAGNTRRFISSQPEFNKKLFLPGYVPDADLNRALQQCGALVYPSLEEGFGLPLVEAARLGCPIIARDIEIFRETSGGNAFFFENGDVEEIAAGLRKWFKLTRKQQKKFVPRESLVTWRQSAEMMKAILFRGTPAFTVDVGIKGTVNLAVPGSAKGTP